MAPSTRSKPSTTLDLTLSDSDDSDVVVEQPVLTSKKRATPAKQQQQQPTKKQKGKQAATAREDENASLALAMMLQAEEEDMAAEEEQGIGVSSLPSKHVSAAWSSDFGGRSLSRTARQASETTDATYHPTTQSELMY